MMVLFSSTTSKFQTEASSWWQQSLEFRAPTSTCMSSYSLKYLDSNGIEFASFQGNAWLRYHGLSDSLADNASIYLPLLMRRTYSASYRLQGH
eukprot:2630517-Amphidinium_carterae.1